jgi:2-hydroxy-3-oxopropionate reductase
MTITVGFIGLGIMGTPMALNLRRAGHRIAVWSRRPEAAARLTEAGAERCTTPAAVAAQSEVCFTVVSDTRDVEAVILGNDAGDPEAPGGGADALIAGVRPGTVVVDMSTISPSATRRIAERLATAGAQMLDAPVSGGEQGAIDGTLSIMVGGPVEAFERVRPLLEVMGSRITHVGENGAGQVCKACNQVVVAQTIAGVAEALLLAKASGVDAAKVREALLGGFAYSRILEVHGQRMLDADYAPGFKAALHQKDLRIVLEAAGELGLALPGAAQVQQGLNALVGQGDGDLDSAALYRVLERLNGG